MYRLLLFIVISMLLSCKADEPIKVIDSDITTSSIDYSSTISTLAFGSCSKQNERQPMWKGIADANPDLWIWSGDIIYGDSEDPNVLAKKYNQQLSHPAYQQFTKRVPVIGIWDDHDYGVNNGGKEYTSKIESRNLLFDFLGVTDEKAKGREGAYQSYTYGEGEESIKIFLLDCRYFRDTPKRSADNKRYVPAPGDMLGEEQWEWFEKELIESNAQLNIIVSGVQVIPEDHPYEKWANFPLSRDRLFNLIKSSKSDALLISGDRHIGEISSIDLGEQKLYEVTSSGLTHSWDSFPGEENQHRVSEVVPLLNFGLLSINWGAEPVTVSAEIRGLDNTPIEKIEFSLHQ